MGEDLSTDSRSSLRRQRFLGHLVGLTLVWPATLAWLRVWRGYRIHDLATVRRRARALLRTAPGPVLVCPNHLTWIDSLLVQWALCSPLDLLRSFRLFAWNVRERSNFGRNLWLRLYCYIGKCVPIVRGGDRGEQKAVLDKLAYLLRRRELVLVFPEGGRSDRGRVDVDSITYGVGRIATSVENCRVLCVYIRGSRQQGRTILPEPRQSFGVEMAMIEPRAEGTGLRAMRDTARQIGRELSRLEERYFACR
ncbi:MAG: 1-acyl-sn-glycerol-3-phosphate acyltransferase [Myxococcales bacterium]|nr:MAG: 1-acyl-sn-glycerol-3-phosphate acyltransferase [Myxococcales bacterium]